MRNGQKVTIYEGRCGHSPESKEPSRFETGMNGWSPTSNTGYGEPTGVAFGTWDRREGRYAQATEAGTSEGMRTSSRMARSAIRATS